jgi:hypothetical protein
VTETFLIDATQTQPTQDVEDMAFYQRFQRADPRVKHKLKRIFDTLDDED